MNINDKIQQAKSIINGNKTVEQELRDMFTKEQFAILLGIPENTQIRISKLKLAKALVLKWKVEK